MSDLISREALKKSIEDEVTFIDADSLYKIIDIINNAPIVDTYTLEDIQEVQENSLILGAKLAQRPQGEWVRKGYEPYGVCSVCGELRELDNFCGNCGADMRKGGAG